MYAKVGTFGSTVNTHDMLLIPWPDLHRRPHNAVKVGILRARRFTPYLGPDHASTGQLGTAKGFSSRC